MLQHYDFNIANWIVLHATHNSSIVRKCVLDDLHGILIYFLKLHASHAEFLEWHTEQFNETVVS